MNLNQVTVAVTNIERSTEFYERLGLKLIVKAEHYARFIVHGNEATFSIHRTEQYRPNETTIYFEVTNVDKTIADLKLKGFDIVTEPVLQKWLWYEAYLEDPDGNKICIYHAGENRLNPPWRIRK
ncbi:MAG TPA: VOC family protein [Chitinophagaceae bacterium]|nr:VOC family protein [Chitinophagaceae bacterium]